MTFTSEEFDRFYGPWTEERIALVRKYMAEPVHCWTEREVIIGKFLNEAMTVIEKLVSA